MVQLSNSDYAKLIESKGALTVALVRLANVVEAVQRKGDDCVPASMRDLGDDDVADAVNDARTTLALYP